MGTRFCGTELFTLFSTVTQLLKVKLRLLYGLPREQNFFSLAGVPVTQTTTANTEVCVRFSILNGKPCRIVVVSVFGAIAVCLFPLWPPEVRLGVYYLSVAAAGFVGLIFVLCISKLRGILMST